MFLDAILEKKREDIEQAKARAFALPARPVRKVPSLLAALEAPGTHLICEIKRASPSRGPLNLTLDPGSLALIYERSGASGISVLTEPHYFRGSLEDLTSVTGKVTIPVLRKDFILDPI